MQTTIMSMFLTVLLFCALPAEANLSCATLLNSELFKRLNPTAQYSAKEYQQPNQRGLEDYDSILLQQSSIKKSLIDFLPPVDSLVVDIGGGHGLAMREIVQETRTKAIVINTQDYSNEISPELRNAGFEFRSGWAEEVLTKMKSGTADLVTDLWGGFSYSPRKDLIIEQVYRVLKPGGTALILFHPIKTPAFVHTRFAKFKVFGIELLQKERDVSFDKYLTTRYPDLFKSYYSEDPSYGQSRIIRLTKPMVGPEAFALRLEVVETELIEAPRNVYPKVRFVVGGE